MSMYPIASASGSSAQFFQLFNIPQTFTHLQIRVTATNPTTGNVILNYATGGGSIDYGTNYRFHAITGNGSTATSGDSGASATAAVSAYVAGQAASIPLSIIIDVLDYTNTNKNKVSRSLYGYDLNGSGQVGMYSGLWLNTGAVTGVAIGFNGATSNLRLDVYGIATSNIGTY